MKVCVICWMSESFFILKRTKAFMSKISTSSYSVLGWSRIEIKVEFFKFRSKLCGAYEEGGDSESTIIKPVNHTSCLT